jgi:integral membrane protein (TIGR01906 family)
VLFVLCVPVLLVLSNVRSLVFDARLYERGYERYHVSATTGMSREELQKATQQIMAYFAHGTPVTLRIQKEHGEAPLFNEKETRHLADVRDLLDRLFAVQTIAGLYVLGFVLTSFWWGRPRPLSALGSHAIAGGATTLGLFALAGLGAFVAFDWLFVRFHLISFTNDDWLLDPRTDYMIRMFPRGFWLDATLGLAATTMAQAGALTLSGLLLRRLAARWARTPVAR